MDFLQSKIWWKFQRAVGREVFEVAGVSIIKHILPIVGDYFYIPRWPAIRFKNYDLGFKNKFDEILKLAKKEKAGWIRIEPGTENALNAIKNSLGNSVSKLVKAPHDMQPKETFVIDISKSEEELLAGMKQKTRYNLNLAKKKNIKIFSVNNEQEAANKYIDEFLRLVKITSERDGIKSHPAKYYRQMMETIPAENLQIYLAEYENKIIAANIVIFFEDAAIYLHGASDNEYRNVMAPYLLQWQQIIEAKNKGCKKYDFGGIKTGGEGKSWAGITRFKLGFSPQTPSTRFPGCYDIILSPGKYKIYRIIQKSKVLFKKLNFLSYNKNI